jgi:enamine deaminase RidA (YjgF/YER057c/UK114 family)
MERIHIRSASPYEPAYGFSRAVRVGTRVLVAGTAPVPPAGEEVAATTYDQMRRCCDIVADALARAGARIDDVVRTRMYLVDPADAPEVGRAHAEVFGAAAPAATMAVVAALIVPEWKIELEVEAVIDG